MPRRPPTPCTADPRCPRLVPRPGPCAEHGRERERARKARATWHDYGADWQRVRRQALELRPVCACGAPAVDVDHVVPLRNGGTHDLRNLQPLCRSCHSKKTARENGFGGRRD